MTAAASTDRPAASGAADSVWRFAPALLSGLAFAWFTTFLPAIGAGEVLRYAWPWIPGMGVELSFLIDGLALVFALLITGIGALVLLYTAAYFKTHPALWRLLVLLGLFELSMLGLVVADNLVVMFVFWELTTITSFLLVGFDHEKADARAKALQALLVTAAGGLALLAGVLLIGMLTGTFEASALVEHRELLLESGFYTAIVILVLLGCFTKSAQFPFHFWLPNAMAAPTPVSAYLHSATMVKAGVYLMARLNPSLGGTDLWFWTLVLFGGVTAVLSSIWALRQTDLKLGLAYTTVMGLGTLTMLIGFGTTYAITAAATFLIVHALYKAALFLTIGILDKKAGTREIDELSGLGRRMPATWVVAALAGLSMAGLPPLFGFIAKELIYEAGLGEGASGLLVLLFAFTASAMMVAVAAAVAVKPFVGRRGAAAERAGEAPFFMWLGPAILAAGGLAFGLMPDWAGTYLVIPTADAVQGTPVDMYLKLWHGVNLALGLSAVTTIAGIVIYLRLASIRRGLAHAEARGIWDCERGYDVALKGLKDVASWQTAVIQSGEVTRYIFWTVLTLAVLLWSAIILGGGIGMPTFESLPLMELAVLGLVLFGTLAVTLTRSRLIAIVALGVVGVAIAGFFVLYGAIDVAMTQLLVETLFVVIVVVALLRLPRLATATPHWDKGPRWGHVAVSVALGAAVTVSLLAVLETDLDRRLTTYFEAESAPTAFGRNIVNVILVDFRALDTFGEIAVVIIAALGALALLRIKPERAAAKGEAR
ncbi:MAG: putative monovalent cation/H+ antiporter subunit A [Pseudomonadota bacterium]